MPDCTDLTTLLTGDARQQQAYHTLHALGILATLQAFDPVLAGTLPLGIATPVSDLDVICAVWPERQGAFRELLHTHYASLPGFVLRETVGQDQAAIVCNFQYQAFAVEVFGQACPSRQQYAVRHMLVEHRVLEAGGEPWRLAIQQLKQQGLKTEPAFATLLRLPGNPYEALLALEPYTVAELRAWLPPLP
ncbi:DUF4269 domain-containing protein [Hymenobacter aerilatus]|uniref:DUF4269 domain-containing protein n=1 Tax=Hymenobacter aerilatus TaxID=2932251 RepID=A0A8T9SUN4_9BACT|nr:DUF4269 domain-containing protein [Hymenobacter aerilatus]UOR05081.1 DUF4269 domain-containing protein [Hymenobacter aerilatus]